MKAVRLHAFHQQPVIDEVPEPAIGGPLDVIVKIGGAGVCRTDLHIIEGQKIPKAMADALEAQIVPARVAGHPELARRRFDYWWFTRCQLCRHRLWTR